jgi:FkbM family methyltransferase
VLTWGYFTRGTTSCQRSAKLVANGILGAARLTWPYFCRSALSERDREDWALRLDQGPDQNRKMRVLHKLRQIPLTVRSLLTHPLNRGRPFSAVARFLRWHIGSRLVPGPVAVPLTGEIRILAAPGMPGATGAAYLGLHEYADMAFVLHFLRPDDLFVDVGANVGSYTLLAASTGANCVAFEPLPDTYRKLVRNIGMNGLALRVDAVNAGVASEAGELRFTADLDTDNHVALDGYKGRIEKIPVTTLDEKVGNSNVSLVKIDVEGFEAEVIRGARHLLTNRPPAALIIEVNDASHRYSSDEEGFVGLMRGFGYTPFDYEPTTRRLMAIPSVSRISNNTLFCRDVELVRRVVGSGPKRTILGRDI